MSLHSWLESLPANEAPAAQRWGSRLHWVVLASVLLTIPAFYLEAVGPSLLPWRLGSALYALSACMLIAQTLWMWRLCRHRAAYLRRSVPDLMIAAGGLLSLAGSFGQWSMAEWLLRLLLVLITFLRLMVLSRGLFSPRGAFYAVALSAVTLALAGFGFYWLEPTVHSYADGLWLAFVTGATVGYGDVVPTTPASRLFAAFMVLLGYALFSLVTASIAAAFVGEDEKELRREMHREMKMLRGEIEALREELRARPRH